MKLNRNLLCVLLLLSFIVTLMSSCWYQRGKSSRARLPEGEVEVYSEKKMKRHERQSARLNKFILREEQRRQAKRKK